MKAIVKRDIRFKVLEEEDLKWLWAAYKRGAFKWLPSDMDGQVFKDRALKLLATVSEAFVAYAPGHLDDQPVGLISLAIDQHDNYEVHVEWFPWATARNKIEVTAKFLREVGRYKNLVVYSEVKNKRFFERMMDYGILRRVGHVSNFFRGGDQAIMFQSRMT